MLQKHIFIPGNILSAQKYLFGCADFYLSAQTFIYQPWIFLYWPVDILVSCKTFWHSHRNLFIAQKYIPTPRKYLLSPRNLLYFSCADFWFFPFWDCRIALIMKMIHCWQLWHYSWSLKCHINVTSLCKLPYCLCKLLIWRRYPKGSANWIAAVKVKYYLRGTSKLGQSTFTSDVTWFGFELQNLRMTQFLITF